MKKERRALERLYPERDMQVIFKGPKPIVGTIYNISTKGVSVEYDGRNRPQMDRDVSIKLALDLQSALIVDDILCTPIYDIPTLARKKTFRGVNMRLCGLKYADLNQTDQSMLQKLLASTD